MNFESRLHYGSPRMKRHDEYKGMVRDKVKAHTHKHTLNHFTVLLDFVRDYLGQPAP